MPRKPRGGKNGRPQKFTDQQIIDALKACKGMVYMAARSIECSAETIFERAKTVEAVADVMKAENGVVDDAAEMVLYEAILAKEAWAVQFRLSRKGKHRGYTDKTEVEVMGAARKVIVEEVIDAPDGASDDQTA